MSTTREWRDSYRIDTRKVGYAKILLYLREENSQRRNECTCSVARPVQDQGNLRDVERVKKKKKDWEGRRKTWGNLNGGISTGRSNDTTDCIREKN